MNPRPIDIIIPIYRNAELVKACVDSLLEHRHEIAARVPRLVLINDSPDDPQVEGLLGAYAASESDLVVLRNEANIGFVGTVNRGLHLGLCARHDAILVNSDTVTFPGTLAELLRVANADPQIAFVSPRSNNGSICSLPHFHGGTPPSPQAAYERWRLLSRTMPALHFAPTGVGFFLYIAYAVLANFGGLSEEFGIGYEEENDLVMRAGKVGLRAAIANHAFAYHAGAASFTLAGIDLHAHKNQNLRKLVEIHPEFLPLARRYESGPHFRAERLMAGLLPDAQGRFRLVIDLTSLGRHFNGTNEHALAVVRSLARRWTGRFALSAICTAESFEFHGLDKVADLHRVEPGAPGRYHAIAIRIGQPFAMHHISVPESIAPINVFAMLDTIAEDSGPLAIQGDPGSLWDHVARHANGLLFNSRFSEQTFLARHPDAESLPRMTALLPTRIACYAPTGTASAVGESHVLVLGNHFPHKGSEKAARQLAASFPTLQIVVLGAHTFQQGNLISHRSGSLAPEQMSALYAGASAVVLPSHSEGFGLGFMHALAVGRPIVARRIPATEEILDTLDDVRGVEIFDCDAELPAALSRALEAGRSSAQDHRGGTWDDWTDTVANFCLDLLRAPDVFTQLAARIGAGDLLRKAAVADYLEQAAPTAASSQHRGRGTAAAAAQPMELAELMQLDGREFIEHAYATLLQRPVDESGLAFYMAELEAGIDKEEIVRVLAISTEGRARKVQLAGLDALLAARASRGLRHGC